MAGVGLRGSDRWASSIRNGRKVFAVVSTASRVATPGSPPMLTMSPEADRVVIPASKSEKD